MRLLSGMRAAPAVAFVALAAGGLGGCISTATYGTGEAPETTLLREATGGMFSKLEGEEKAAIDYEPRAGLVIPPAAQLPEPSPAPAQLAGGTWPVEPTAEEFRVVAEKDQTRVLTPEYTRRMQAIAGGSSNPAIRAQTRQQRRYEQSPAKAFLAEQNGRKDFEAALAEAEGLNSTERRFLTDPPSTYRKPAESAPTEFADIEKKKGGGVGAFFARVFGN